MLGEGPVGYSVREVFRVADRSGYVDMQARVLAADVIEQPGQIFLEMPALGEKQRDDRDAYESAGLQTGYCVGQRWPHELQKRQFDMRLRIIAAQSCHDPAKRLGPRRVAGAVCEKKNRRTRRLAHVEIEKSGMPASVADWETGRGGAAG